ncbi:MAG: glutamine amidotransferase [Candidatus Cloacimonadota bacterium]|nr:MAG: glutamine amidotransferase [Candidatus Cloacimonadota bacterium]
MNIAILKMGTIRKSVSEDYDVLLIDGIGLSTDHFTIIDVPNGNELPYDIELDGIVISGASKMLTDEFDWLEPLSEWLRYFAKKHVPILGICFGHQIIAHAWGGKVLDNPNEIEVGTKQIDFRKEVKNDQLLKEYYPVINAQVSHVQSVITLPEDTIVLASSKQEPYQAFRIGENIWGLQFHPEFNADVIKKLIVSKDKKYPGKIDVDRLLAEVKETPESYSILRKFGEIVTSNS